MEAEHAMVVDLDLISQKRLMAMTASSLAILPARTERNIS